MRRTIDEAKDLSGRLALMQQDARDLVAELGRIVGALGTGGIPESRRGDEWPVRFATGGTPSCSKSLPGR